MITALLLIVYLSIGIWIAIHIGRETDGYTIFACGMIWLPCLVWYAVKKARKVMAT